MEDLKQTKKTQKTRNKTSNVSIIFPAMFLNMLEMESPSLESTKDDIVQNFERAMSQTLNINSRSIHVGLYKYSF